MKKYKDVSEFTVNFHTISICKKKDNTEDYKVPELLANAQGITLIKYKLRDIKTQLEALHNCTREIGKQECQKKF